MKNFSCTDIYKKREIKSIYYSKVHVFLAKICEWINYNSNTIKQF